MTDMNKIRDKMLPEDIFLMNAAIGRMFIMISSNKQNDNKDLQMCYSTIMNIADKYNINCIDKTPNYLRDKNKGAQGD